jgi:hypothetical protein
MYLDCNSFTISLYLTCHSHVWMTEWMIHTQESRNAYYQKNYPDWFASVGKTMVRRPDGTFFTVSDAELESLKQQNKLTLEIPRAMGGRVTDVTQRPILILRE